MYPKGHSPQEGPVVLSVPFCKVLGTRKLTICGECLTRAGTCCCCGVTGRSVPVFEGVLILLLTLLGTHVSDTFLLASPRTPFLIPLRDPVLMVSLQHSPRPRFPLTCSPSQPLGSPFSLLLTSGAHSCSQPLLQQCVSLPQEQAVLLKRGFWCSILPKASRERKQPERASFLILRGMPCSGYWFANLPKRRG